MIVSPASGTSLAVTFTPSSLAQSLVLLEWDTAPHAPEVQALSTSIFTGPNEVQAITTWAPRLDEVQLVRTRASPLPSIQSITTSAALGETLTGSFTLLLDLTPFGGGLHTSGNIQHDAAGFAGQGGAPNRTSLAEVLSAIPGVGAVGATRAGPDDAGGYTWSVTFTGLPGAVPLLSLGSSSLGGLGAAVSTALLQAGAVLGGAFKLGLGGSTTTPLPFDATPAEVEAALGGLPAVDAVSVSRVGPDAVGGFVWGITFVGNAPGGNVPTLDIDATGLTGGWNTRGVVCAAPAYSSNASSAILADCVGGSGGAGDLLGALPLTPGSSAALELTAALPACSLWGAITPPVDGNQLGGNFSIGVPGAGPGGAVAYTAAIPFDADAATVAAALTATGGVGSVDVQRSEGGSGPLGGGGGGGGASFGYTWTVRWTSLGGSRATLLPLPSSPPLPASPLPFGVNLTGIGAGVVVTVLHDGTTREVQTLSLPLAAAGVPLNGSIVLSFGVCSTTPLYVVGTNCSALNASSLAAALEALPTVDSDVTVTCVVAGAGAAGGPLYSITFAQGPAVAGGALPLLALNVTAASGGGTLSGLAPANASAPCITRTAASNAIPITGQFAVVVAAASPSAAAVTGTGGRTAYLPYNASAGDVKAALEAVPGVGIVDVARSAPAVDGGFTWVVTFVSAVGPQAPLEMDVGGLAGTFVAGSVTRTVPGVAPPFNSGVAGGPLGAVNISVPNVAAGWGRWRGAGAAGGSDSRYEGDSELKNTAGDGGGGYDASDAAAPSPFTTVIDGLSQGAGYYIRITPTSPSYGVGSGGGGGVYTQISALGAPAPAVPLPQSPSAPLSVTLNSTSGSSVSVGWGAPANDGGSAVDAFLIEWDVAPLVFEVQSVAIVSAAAASVGPSGE